MKAYKGFKRDMTCRGFRFEEGKTYEEPEAELCKKGFHACEHPLACFNYYAPANNVFHEVEVDEVAEERGSDTKLAAKKITIGARLDIAGLVKAAVDFVFARADWSKKEQHDTGRWGAASATGYQGAASATGYQGAASATGRCGAASATGDQGAASATGYQGAASATGDQGAAVSLGIDGKAKAALGCWITLAEWQENDKTKEWERVDVQTRKVDGTVILPDIWYQLKGGKFVPVKENDNE